MVSYEWDVETVTTVDSEEHEKGEVLDHNHFDTYAEARDFAAGEPDDGTEYVLVLVRDSDATGRSWAYMENGFLPGQFEDAYQQQVAAVPTRFHREVAR